MSARPWFGSVLAIAVAFGVSTAAQIGGKPAKGNPTPGTPQPEPPKLADRITLTGCVQMAPARNTSSSSVDPNTPSDARFVLANAERLKTVPPGTGGSDVTTATPSRTYRLQAIESQLFGFVGAKVEVSGEVTARAANSRGEAGDNAPTLQVEFVQKIAASCP